MTRLPSIRRRLSWLLLATAMAWGLAVSAVVWLAVRHEVNELLDDTLRASAEVLHGLLSAGGGTLPSPLAAPTAAAHDERFAWQLVGAGSQVIGRSARAPATPLLPLPTYGFADVADQWRVFGLRFGDGERVLYVAQTRAERREAQAEVALSTVLAALAVGLASAAWLRARLRRELAPVVELSTLLARYEPLDPQSRLGPAAREELLPVLAAIDELGQRLARRVANERAFSAHAAHALRTPLAGIDTQLAVAMRECPPELRPRLDRVRQAAGRLTRVVAALLAMFRSGVELQWQPVDLAGLLTRLPVDGLEVQVDATAPLQADPDLISAALLNLLDNAIRHGAGRVRVALRQEAGVQHLQFDDDGHGVAPAQRAALNAALETQAYEGRMGLGLMLTDLVARAHGGSLWLPPATSGFSVALSLGHPPPSGEAASPHV